MSLCWTSSHSPRISRRPGAASREGICTGALLQQELARSRGEPTAVILWTHGEPRLVVGGEALLLPRHLGHAIQVRSGLSKSANGLAALLTALLPAHDAAIPGVTVATTRREVRIGLDEDDRALGG